jgi:serine/threonine-protein kinase
VPLEPGTQLGPYEIKSAIGTGGMGEVYRARDHRLERDVAVKVLPTHFKPGSRQLEQFDHEARLLASLNHPGICGIYDVGSVRGVSFIVMEHLQGETLAARIERGPISAGIALRYAIQVAEALQAAHGAGLVHRDIKPGNIMLTTMGVKLLDFGLAKRHMSAPAAAKAGGPQSAAATGPVDTSPMEGIVGTLHYMSPEQLAGGVVDARSDIWAFGCVIYEMVAGRRAFNGKTMTEVIAAIVTEHPSVMTLESGVAPIALEHLVSKCLARNPIERWQTVGDLMGELRSMLPHANPQPAAQAAVAAAIAKAPPVAAAPAQPTPAEPVRPRSARWRAVAIAAAVVVVASSAAAWKVLGGLGTRPGQVIAVLRFATAGGPADTDYWGEGLADGVAGELAHVQGVSALPASVTFRQDSQDPQKAGRELGADRVVAGRVVTRSGRLDVDVRLLNVTSGAELWRDHFSAPAADASALQRELVAGILKASNIQKAEGAGPAALPSQVNGDAYRLLLRGRSALNRRDERSLKEAIGFFNEAVAKDARLASAFAGIAEANSSLAHFTLEAARPREAMQNAKAAAVKAIELDPSLASAHVALGYAKAIGERDWTGAGAEFERAVALQPSDPLPHQWRSEWLMAMGRSEEALAEARTAARLDPLSPAASLNLGWQLLLARQQPEAVTQLKATVAANPSMAAARWALGVSYAESGRLDDAIVELKAASAAAPGRTHYLASLAYAHAQAHHATEAAQLLARLRGLSAREYVSPFGLALVALELDDSAHALEWLGQAVDDHASAVTLLAADPRWDTLRSDSRFKDLLKRAGL